MSKHRPTLLRKLIWTLRSMSIGKVERKKSEMIDITGNVSIDQLIQRVTYWLEK